jgi:hypothetical protein
LTRKTREVAERMAEAGAMPLEVMVSVMREFWHRARFRRDGQPRAEMDMVNAKAAADLADRCASYMHPRLAAIQAIVGGEVQHTHVIAARDLTPEEWEAEGKRLLEPSTTQH